MTLDRPHLDRLLAAAAEGERAAIEPLFRALWPIVVAYATRMLGDAALAEDCAQEALVRLFGQLDRYDRSRDALTWALTLATWQCRTARRRAGRRGEVGASQAPEPAQDGRAIAEERELARAALAALATLAALRPRDAAIIAEAIDSDPDSELRRTLAPATFRKRLERALERFRLMWRSRHGTL